MTLHLARCVGGESKRLHTGRLGVAVVLPAHVQRVPAQHVTICFIRNDRWLTARRAPQDTPLPLQNRRWCGG
jgi:hypothetical protein